MRKFLLLLSILFTALSVQGQTYLLTGRVTDQKDKAISFAVVYIRNSTYGTVANEDGRYQFKLTPGEYNLVYRFVGYKEISQKITIADNNVQHNVQMTDENYALKQVSNDSALDIMRRVIDKREYYLKQVDKYSCVVYVKGVQKLDHAPKSLMGQNVADALSVDSTGKGILYQSESLSNYNFAQPDKIKEEMIATKALGRNAAFSYNKASDLAVNFYNNIFSMQGLSSHGFISPLASTPSTFTGIT